MGRASLLFVPPAGAECKGCAAPVELRAVYLIS
jgi:hypothetical protein